MINAIRLFNQVQCGSEAAINVLVEFLTEEYDDSWGSKTQDEKVEAVRQYADRLYY